MESTVNAFLSFLLGMFLNPILENDDRMNRRIRKTINTIKLIVNRDRRAKKGLATHPMTTLNCSGRVMSQSITYLERYGKSRKTEAIVPMTITSTTRRFLQLDSSLHPQVARH
jgi:hypothetical protein